MNNPIAVAMFLVWCVISLVFCLDWSAFGLFPAVVGFMIFCSLTNKS